MSLSYGHYLIKLQHAVTVYLVQPQHLPREDIEQSKEWPLMYGEQIAVKFENDWILTNGKTKVTDIKLIQSLENCPKLICRPL
jgi:hypothetical protein